jgi:hypothetical protein
MNGLQLELCTPYYIDSKIMQNPAYQLRRLDNRGKRVYYRILNNEPLIYTGVTSMIKSTLPTSPQLIEWYKKNGSDADEMGNEAADYGTLMHIICQKLLVEGEYNFENLIHDISNFCAEQQLDKKYFVNKYYEKLQRDILSFAQWVLDYKVIPIAIEQVLCSDQHRFAGAIDLVCKLTITEKGTDGSVLKSGPNKGQLKIVNIEKEILAIVDFKSGRKGFWESHEIQLKAYELLVHENYPNLKVEKLYNWSPKEWVSTPSYNFKDQTGAKSQQKLQHLIPLYHMDNNDASKKIMLYDDVINLKEGNPGSIREISYYDYINLINKK